MKSPPCLACGFAVLLLTVLATGAPITADPTASSPSVLVPAGVTGLTASVVHHADPALEERARNWMRDMAPGWMPNRGQVAGRNGRVAANVLYSLRSENAQLHVTRRGLTAFFLAGEDREREERERRVREARGNDRDESRDEGDDADWSALEIELVGASIRPERAIVERRMEALGDQHFYAPHCPEGVLAVPSYERVTFRDVYPGIDWVLVADPGGAMHQDFVVRPGADPNRIRIRYHGARGLALDEARRTLRLRTALGEVSEGPLRCWQGPDSTDVPARFALRGDLLSVQLAAYDRSAPLTIDPPLLWSTLYGGGNYDGPKSIYCDNRNGDVYVVGYTASADLPCTTAVAPLAYFQGVSNPQVPPDAFIWKFTQQGVRQWATYYSGNGEDYAVDCAVDRLGNLYVTGQTASTDWPTQQLSGAYWQPNNGGGIDAFVLRFDAQGVRQWATYYGGDENDFGTAVTTDSTDQVFIAGYSASRNLNLANPGGGAYYQPSLDGTSDAFILRFNTLGALVWGTYFGGDSGEQAFGIAVNATHLAVVGITYSTVFPTVDPPGNGDYFQGTPGGQQDAFLARFTLGGVQTWSTFYGGSGFDETREPAFTASGQLYVSGLSNSTDLPVFNPNPVATPNQPAYFQGTNAGQFDLVMLRIDPANGMPWATYVGGTASEDLGRGARSLAVDSQGRAHITGVSASNNLPFANPGGGAYFQNSTTNSDVVYARFTTTDSLEWCTFFGGNGASFGTAVAIGVGDCLFGTGEFQSSGFNTPPVNPGFGAWFRTTNSGNDDGFVTRFCEKRSACCIDLLCFPVTSAADCAAIGGNAYHHLQTCAQTNCNILCTICGRKFKDSNRNGVQDGGEPGLAGWTIELRNGANAIVATAVTGANGDYCFNNVPCAPYLVTEAVQNGWVKIAPAGPGHSVAPPIATTLNNIDFANYLCPIAPPCTFFPPGLAAWWPFDDGPGTTQATDVTHASGGRNRALLLGAATSGAGSLCLPNPTAAARVPAAELSGFAFGAGSFGVSVWVSPDAGAANGRTVIEQRGPDLGGGLSGWWLHLDGMRCMLMLTTGSAPQVVPGPELPPGTWSHVAVSVDRATGVGRWYLNGAPFAAADFTPIAGSLDNGGDLWIGQNDPALSGASGPGLQGCLAQLAVFHTPISADMAAKAFGPGPGTGVPVAWCPDYVVLPATRTICSSQTSVQVCFNIGNTSASPVTYSWSLAGLPAGPGCSTPGPTQFSPSSGTVTVPAGGLSASICVTIQRPNGFTQQAATACYALTFVNHTTGVCRTRSAAIKVDNSCWCSTANPTAIAPVPAGGRVVGFTIKRPCDPIALIPYRIVPRDPETGAPDSAYVSLDGHAPGTPLTGAVNAGPQGDATVQAHVDYPAGFDAATIRELVLEADTDGDGTYEALASRFVLPAPEEGAVDAPGLATAERPALRASPTPFLVGTTLSFTLGAAEPVALEIYDSSGRLVRSLVRGLLPAGPRRVTWDGRDDGGRRLAAGIYFARLRTSHGTQDARLVKVQ